jgi:hypothetical protein
VKLNPFKIPKKYILWAMLLPVTYGLFVLGFVWWQCFTSPLLGGRNGPLDAYRHTLASAVVAYTTSPKIVGLVSTIMERKGYAANLMDVHNNTIGAQIGNNAANFSALKPAVILHISQGAINANTATQTTWLPPPYWSESVLW